MAKCAFCGSTIIAGGIKNGELTFCNQDCFDKGVLTQWADMIPAELVERQVRAIHQGICPKCQGKGPVDVHVSHQVCSFIFKTSWKSTPGICCRSCGIKGRIGDIVYCALLGWWGIPWGLILTLVQIIRNLLGIIFTPNPAIPSEALYHYVRIDMASREVQKRQRLI
ncbi:hypothetical protein JW926_05220 [Candidatus Sumerlaeota bacterium]|nr:hypothetical protein [Candidatus Sumerlaeota bacterium]